MLKCQLSRY